VDFVWKQTIKTFPQSTWDSDLKLQKFNTKMNSPTPSGTPSLPIFSGASTPTLLSGEPESFPDYSI
jgi:hypothetical protein